MENLHIGDKLVSTRVIFGFENGTIFEIIGISNDAIKFAVGENEEITLNKHYVAKIFKVLETKEEKEDDTSFLLSMTESDITLVESVMFEDNLDIVKIPVLKDNIISHTIRPNKETGLVILELPNEVIDLLANEDVISSITIADIDEWYKTAKVVNKSKCNNCTDCNCEK